MKRNGAQRSSAATDENEEPRVIEITPDGRRIVDPMSILESEAARQHLEDISNLRIAVSKPNEDAIPRAVPRRCSRY